ncbi:MAG: STAS-like domain-containing protein [Rhodanobacteraceae bacterium]
MPQSRSDPIDAALLAAVTAHPRDLTSFVASQLGVSRQTTAARARALVKSGLLARSGTTRPTYVLGPTRFGEFAYALEDLAEDRVWSQDVAPRLNNLPANVIDIAHYGLTEMVNNAIDHSEGKKLSVTVLSNDGRTTLWVADDGIGIFRKIAAALDLPDDRFALLELSKGKFTTDPARHTGEGVFFTSRAFDHFEIAAGGLAFDHLAGHDMDVLHENKPEDVKSGTTIIMSVATDSARTLKQVFEEFSSGPDDYSFAKTIVPVRLAQVSDENLISRSQGKRLMQRVDQFRCVMLDFTGVTTIGPAFADEVFRVFAREHPKVEIMPIHAVPEIQQMIRRAEIARDRQKGS